MIYKRYEGESEEELIYRICEDKDQIGTWSDVADILNDLLNVNYSESTYRKKYSAFQKMFEANRARFADSKAELSAIHEAERKLERERIRFRDERNAWQKQNYVAARAEDKLDKLEEMLSGIGRVIFPSILPKEFKSNNTTMLVMLEDLHIGATFDSYWGTYDTDVAKDRMGILLERIKDIQKTHNCDECVVSIQGDLISGSIHKSIQVTNREDVIEQVKIASELISSFCYELTKIFNTVTAVSVTGNHSRIDKKEDAMHSERLDDLVMWSVDLSLKHIINFRYASEYNIDTDIALIPIRGKYYVAVHGDYDSFAKQGVQNLVTMIHLFPYAVLFGHMHTCAIDECNGIKMIRGGSLCGSGDQFTIEKRLCGNASQMVCICDTEGVKAYYPVELE